MTLLRDSGFRTMMVVSTHRISDRMLRLRLTGRDLDRFDTFQNLHLRLYIAANQESLHQSLSASKAASIASSGAFFMRSYTISDIDVQAGWLDIDFVLHEGSGPACDFARKARPGDLCFISGPCGRSVKPAARYLLVGDETALPAIARIARNLCPKVVGEIFIQYKNSKGAKINMTGDIPVRWFPPEATILLRSAVKDAITRLQPYVDDHFIWIAGEAADCAALEPFLEPIRKSRRINVPYWRQR